MIWYKYRRGEDGNEALLDEKASVVNQSVLQSCRHWRTSIIVSISSKRGCFDGYRTVAKILKNSQLGLTAGNSCRWSTQLKRCRQLPLRLGPILFCVTHRKMKQDEESLARYMGG